MPAWLGIAVGVVAGAGVIAGAVYLAFRPYLAVKAPRAWLPEPTGMAVRDEFTGAGGGPCGDFTGGGMSH